VSPSERAAELATRVIGPLVLGGSIRPTRPFGPEAALAVGLEQRIPDDALRTAVDDARTRSARALVPIEVLPDLQPMEWTMAAALNDLLQVTNDELSSFATRGRHVALLRATRALCDAIAPPTDHAEVVARHASFGRLLGLSRTDVRLSWWTGSALFRGHEPPPRLQLWPRLRRVESVSSSVALADMAAGTPVDPDEYLDCVGALLRCSPLTDLATLGRPSPGFAWSPSTLGLVATHNGCNLVLRAFARRDPSASVWARECGALGAAAIGALAQATAALAPGTAPARIAVGFAELFRAAVEAWTAEATAA
jgi:hypothetical protein